MWIVETSLRMGVAVSGTRCVKIVEKRRRCWIEVVGGVLSGTDGSPGRL